MDSTLNALSLLRRDLGNFTSPITAKHGYLSASHMSNITAGWSQSTLPTPYPLVIVSSVVSFVFAVIGWKTAASTWVRPGDRKRFQRPEGFESWTWRQRLEWSRNYSRQVQVQAREQLDEDEAAYRERLDNEEATYHEADMAEHIPLRVPYDAGANKVRSSQPSGFTPFDETNTLNDLTDFNQSNEPLVQAPIDHHLQIARAPIMQWEASGKNKILVLVSVVYSTLRAIFAFKATLTIAISRNGTHMAISSLFLLYLSLQSFISNRKLPRLITLIVVLDLLLVGVAFLISAWDWHSHSYGDAILQGANCPVFADDCTSQAYQWTRVGCGSVLPAARGDGDQTRYSPNPNYYARFYPPYGTGGDINSKGAQNSLRIMEAVIGGCGTFWVGITLLATLYEAFRVFVSLESMAHLLWPIPMEDQFKANKKTGKIRKRMGWTAMSIFTLLALPGAFIVTILSVAGHIAGETHTYTATYIDSFGPAVKTNVTYLGSPGFRTVNSTAYWGNSTSWSDCFTVTTMTSPNGFFDEWMQHNEQVAFRLISLL